MAKAKLARNPAGKETELSPSRAIKKDAIAQRAYELYMARGCEDGHHLEDWLQAERELQETNEISKQKTRRLSN
jgi:DUF2934 family protein